MTGHDAIAGLVESTAGLHFGEHQRRRLVRAVDRAAADARCPDLESYADLLGRDVDALHRLVDALTVGETYFFRDEAQGRLVQSILVEVAQARAWGPVEVWSAGCATGEEAYTIAMLADEVGLGSRVRVLGTDVSPAALAVAGAARYGGRSLRAATDQQRHRWFEDDGTARQVVPEVRARVLFRPANLLAGPPGTFDLVVCRNVLIYFSPAAVERAATVLHDALRPGGRLVPGSSDPPLHAAGLIRERTGHGLVYRRHDRAATARLPGREPARRRPPVAVGAPRPDPAPEPRGATVTAAEIRRLADAGRGADAVEALREAVQARPFDADLRYLDALFHLDAGRLVEAADAARAALYLDPDLAVAHLVVAHVEQARGNRAAAARSYTVAARALAALPPDVRVPGSEQPGAGHLAAMAARLAREASGAR